MSDGINDGYDPWRGGLIEPTIAECYAALQASHKRLQVEHKRLVGNLIYNCEKLEASHKELVDALHRAVTELEFWGKGHSDAEILIAKDALANAEKLTK